MFSQNSGINQRALDLELRDKSNHPFGVNGQRPAADPLLAALSAKSQLSEGSSVFFGRVIECVPYVHVYKVQIEKRNTTILCRDLNQTGLTPYGPKQFNTYSPGTGVFVIYHEKATEGYIIGSVPDVTVSAKRSLSDTLVQGSRVGLQADLVNYFPFTLPGGIPNYSADRPSDSVGGEWGFITETGLSVFLDPFMGFFRVDEATGLFLFYHDQLTRLAGYNLQVRSAGYEQYDMDDQSEFNSVKGWASYLFEAKGRFAPNENSFREFSLNDVNTDKNYYSRYEPLTDDQQAFHRLIEFNGYLGQIYSRFATLQPENKTFFQYTDKAILPGVFEEHISQTGRYTLRSLKGVTIGKTSLIAVPKQIAVPEDTDADTENNYKHAGLYGDGKEHKITGDIPIAVGYDPDEEGLIRAAAFMDQFSYQCNWENLHPFHYHQYDWYVPEETDLPNYFAGIHDFTSLAGKQYLSMPPSRAMFVDHRYGSAQYYVSESFINFSDDGGITLADGYGFELRTSQGSAWLSLPGDLWLMPGKNLNIWSGYDTIVRSLNSVDITTTNNDIRLAANNNVMIASGFNLCGGVLIESKAEHKGYDFADKVGEDVVITGINLVARKSAIVSAADHILMTTNLRYYGEEMHGNEEEADADFGEFEGGPIVIDAGKNTIIEYAGISKRHLGKSAIDVFYKEEEYSVNEYWFDKVSINTHLDVNGRIANTDVIMSSGDITTSAKLADSDGTVYKLESTDCIETTTKQIQDRFATMTTYAEDSNQDGRDLIEGDSDIRLMEFSFRTTEQYKTTNMSLYETKWQQFARLSNQTLTMNLWDEIKAEQLQKDADNSETWPHPGREAWTGYDETEAYNLENLSLYIPGDNLKAPRLTAEFDNLYEDAYINKPLKVVMAENYYMLFPKE